MELRLVIPRASKAGWSLELILPPCSEGGGQMTLDLCGRTVEVDMRGLIGARKHMTVPPSIHPYRIVSFSGSPDHAYVTGIERECPGIPADRAVAFTASGRRDVKGFPRSVELRKSETFAFLWREGVDASFPDELMVDRLSERQGWHLALVTLPSEPSPECEAWLKGVTGLPVAPPAPSIITVWPFLTRSSSVNAVECLRTGAALMVLEMMPVAPHETGPSVMAQSGSSSLKAVGAERSPAFFILKPQKAEVVRIAEAKNPDLALFLSFSSSSERLQRYPAVEFAFRTREDYCRLLPLHSRRCGEAAAEVRSEGLGLEYVSMPPGASGTLRVRGPNGKLDIPLAAGPTNAPHSRFTRLLPPEALGAVASALADSSCDVEIDFGGFGSLRLKGAWVHQMAIQANRGMEPELRSRLRSFMLQLCPVGRPAAKRSDDLALLKAFARLKPDAAMVPHYRSLAKELAASGFELKSLGDGTSR